MFWHCEIILYFFSWGSETLISLEFISTPRNCKIWHRCNTDLFLLIQKPKVCRILKCPLSWINCFFVDAIIEVLSRNIIGLTFNFHSTNIEIFISFLNTLGAELRPSKDIETDKHSLSIWTWYIAGSMNEEKLQNKRPSHVTVLLETFFSKKIDLSFWSDRMKCTN